MYRQRPFQMNDAQWCRSLAEANPFATVVAAPGGHAVGPARIGHVPVILEPGARDVLAFHVATENPLADLAAGDELLVVFHGPHAAVSGSWYADPGHQVPTWNYEAVHATGRVVEVMDLAPAREHVTEVARTFEGPDGWSIDHAPAYADKILPALRAFRVRVDRWEGLAKLSQNKSDEDRMAVGQKLSLSPRESDRLVGAAVFAAARADKPEAQRIRAAVEVNGDAIRLDDFELRPPTATDRDLLVEASQRSAELWTNWGGPPTDADGFDAWLARIDPKVMHRSLAFHKGELLGLVSLQNIVWGHGQYATLGYSGFLPLAGRGLMRRAVALGVDLALDELGLHRVEAGIQPSNRRSIALIRSIGFRFEGLLKRLVKVDGQFRDHELWATDAEDWPGAAALFGTSS